MFAKVHKTIVRLFASAVNRIIGAVAAPVRMVKPDATKIVDAAIGRFDAIVKELERAQDVASKRIDAIYTQYAKLDAEYDDADYAREKARRVKTRIAELIS